MSQPSFHHTDKEQISQEDSRLDAELEIVRKIKQTFAVSLQMLESARDDLVEMGNRMDRLREASELCRKAISEKKAVEKLQKE
jgi:hypothetical protein